MEILIYEEESTKAFNERRILELLVDCPKNWSKLLEETKLSTGVLASHLRKLVEEDSLSKEVRVDEGYPPPVYYRLTEKGLAELVKRQVMAYIAHSKTETKSGLFYLHLTNVLTEIFFKERTKKWWEKLLSLIPEFLSKKLNILDYERMDAFMKAVKKASIIADCLDIFVYSEKPFNFDPAYWPRAYQWICELFQEKLDHPEEVGNYVIAITFDGDKARQLDKTRSEAEALFDYFERMGFKRIRPEEESPKEKPKLPKPPCFKDLTKLSDDTPIPEHCLACEWMLECLKR